MKKKFLSVILAAAMVLSLAACGEKAPADTDASASGSSESSAAPVESSTEPVEELDYQFGEGVTFHSDEPVTYSMFFSDASWYPMVDTWKTEGIFAKIEEMTNVKLDVTSIDSGDYNNKTALMINAGESAYIIPKVYDESPFVDGGAVVAVSDWVQYMPNYTKFYNDYNMEADVNTIVRADGKYYRLPGMKETSLQDYTFMVRTDIFEAAGYDVMELQKTWTWEDLYDILVGVKAYMVSEGMCAESDYIWSDLWCGSESGQGNGGNLLKLIGASYGVPSGWAVMNCMQYDSASDEWYFASTTEDYKEFVTLVNKYIAGGILDPETFTQEDKTANNKFYRGETAIISVNRSQYTAWLQGLDEGLGAGNYQADIVMYPMGSNNFTSENSRLECGVMIATRALEELGEEEFIKMLRFVDWLWFSEEGQIFCKWGVEGETWETKDDGTKGLVDGLYCGGLGIAAEDPDNQKDMRLEWGYAGGNFMMNTGSMEVQTDHFSPVFQNLYANFDEYRDIKPLDPVLVTTEDENEQINLWKTPLLDNVNAWTLQFITGQKDINADWDAYVASCEGLNSKQLVDMYNDIYSRSK